MQALAAYRGWRMLFIGLGTGLGSTLITDGLLLPLELGWLRFDKRHSLLQQLADDSPEQHTLKQWRQDVLSTMGDLKAAFGADEVVPGGRNSLHVMPLPRYCRLVTNAHALL